MNQNWFFFNNSDLLVPKPKSISKTQMSVPVQFHIRHLVPRVALRRQALTKCETLGTRVSTLRNAPQALSQVRIYPEMSLSRRAVLHPYSGVCQYFNAQIVVWLFSLLAAHLAKVE
ncbi:Hypothetical_protein [Hexamita inflata]|uniref:Hypothetical_protein n=1 Tax=Hexamita inflata TaxID=28002 RepID=A0AA86UIJ3_9EUKA|nr:Hypothetical protein HINF_LOCUS40501 [Hexamita inflata]